ncbi:MAG: hypothetical protein K6F76_08290 [Clostridiales bacterium]|nr:hypothetical protein [Clostridiales bacterium]
MNISDITNKIGKSISDVVDFVSDKNKTNAQLSRLKTVMRHEIDALNDCYMELGMYYYENLRDNSDFNTSDLCEQIDSLKANIKAAAEKYNAIKGRNEDVCDGECEIIIETTDDNLKSEPADEEKAEEKQAEEPEMPRKTIKMVLKHDEAAPKAVEPDDDDEDCDDEAEDEED